MFRNFLIALFALMGISVSAVPASATDMNLVVACRDSYLKDHQITEEGARHLQIGTTVNGLTLDGVHLRTVWGACIKQADTVGIVPVATKQPPRVTAQRPAPAVHVAPKVAVPTPMPKPVAAAPQLRTNIPAPAPMVKSMMPPVAQASPAAIPVAAAATAPAAKAAPPVQPSDDAKTKAFMLALGGDPAPVAAKPVATKPAPQYVAPARKDFPLKLALALLFFAIALALLGLFAIKLFRRKPEQPDPNNGQKRNIFDTPPSMVAEAPAPHAVRQEAPATAEFLPLEEEAPAYARLADEDLFAPQPVEEERVGADNDVVATAEPEVQAEEPARPMFYHTADEEDEVILPGEEDLTPSERRKRAETRALAASFGPMPDLSPDPIDGIPDEPSDDEHEHPRAA